MKDKKFLATVILLLIQIAAFPIVRAYGLYNRFWFADILLHIEAGVMFGLFWFWLIRKVELNKVVKYSTAVFFAVFGSFLWEVWEYCGWMIVPGKTQNYIPNLSDSLSDITCGLVGALLISAIHLIYKRFKN